MISAFLPSSILIASSNSFCAKASSALSWRHFREHLMTAALAQSLTALRRRLSGLSARDGAKLGLRLRSGRSPVRGARRPCLSGALPPCIIAACDILTERVCKPRRGSATLAFEPSAVRANVQTTNATLVHARADVKMTSHRPSHCHQVQRAACCVLIHF